MKMPTLVEMLKNGVHFGHQSSRWHTKMAPYIFGVKNGVHVIDLEKTYSKLETALNYLKDVSSKGGVVLFVGTKRQAQEIIKSCALECNMPYVNERWLGGLLTNFPVLLKLTRKYKGLKLKQEGGKLNKYTKKEQLQFAREIARLEKMVGGIASLDKIPDVIFIMDLKREKTAFSEALNRKVKVMAVCDTNADPTNVDYIIPSNDDATKSIEFITRLAAKAINEGKSSSVAVKNSASIIKKEDTSVGVKKETPDVAKKEEKK